MFADPAQDVMLAEMSACAYRLGMEFGREAERVEAWTRKLELVQLFERCFFSVRVAIALKLRLRRGAAAERQDADLREREDPPETDRPETDGLPRERLDADRERETERASLPVLLRTLKGVAADASALPGPQPAELPILRELLAQVAPAQVVLTPGARPPAGGLRVRLTGSTGAAVAISPRPGPAPSLPPLLRPATGPPLSTRR